MLRLEGAEWSMDSSYAGERIGGTVVAQRDGTVMQFDARDAPPQHDGTVELGDVLILDPSGEERARFVLEIPTRVESPDVGGYLVTLSDDGVVAGGFTHSRSPSVEGIGWVARFEDNGDLDPTFGDDGFVPVTVDETPVEVSRLLPRPDGSLIVGVGIPREGWALLRLTSEGEMDSSFGDGGVARLDLQEMMALSSDDAGRILIAGSSGLTRSPTVVRLDADGQPDPSFGADGRLDWSVEGSGAGVDARARDVAASGDRVWMVGEMETEDDWTPIWATASAGETSTGAPRTAPTGTGAIIDLFVRGPEAGIVYCTEPGATFCSATALARIQF
jgi:uncharacterized delta-60 repeat protein